MHPTATRPLVVIPLHGREATWDGDTLAGTCARRNAHSSEPALVGTCACMIPHTRFSLRAKNTRPRYIKLQAWTGTIDTIEESERLAAATDNVTPWVSSIIGGDGEPLTFTDIIDEIFFSHAPILTMTHPNNGRPGSRHALGI